MICTALIVIDLYLVYASRLRPSNILDCGKILSKIEDVVPQAARMWWVPRLAGRSRKDATAAAPRTRRCAGATPGAPAQGPPGRCRPHGDTPRAYRRRSPRRGRTPAPPAGLDPSDQRRRRSRPPSNPAPHWRPHHSAYSASVPLPEHTGQKRPLTNGLATTNTECTVRNERRMKPVSSVSRFAQLLRYQIVYLLLATTFCIERWAQEVGGTEVLPSRRHNPAPPGPDEEPTPAVTRRSRSSGSAREHRAGGVGRRCSASGRAGARSRSAGCWPPRRGGSACRGACPG